MNKLIFKTDKEVIVLYLEENNGEYGYYGFKVINNKKEPLSKDDIKIIDIFKLGLNKKSLGIEDGYEVVLDCDTNFKHYFKNQIEDFEKFILMNSEDLTTYESDNKESKRSTFYRLFLLSAIKGFAVGSIIGIIANQAIIHVSSSEFKYINNKEVEISIGIDNKNNITNYINNSSNLNEKEKALLNNDDFLNLASSYIDEYNFDIYLNDRLNNLNIAYYDDIIDPLPETAGYYNGDNKLHVKYYNEEDPFAKIGTIGHEYNHLFQYPLTSNYVKEAMATILSNEFFGVDNVYAEEVTNIKGLMEIIGPEPLLRYNFSGDLSEIKNLVKDYLDEDDFKEFVRIIGSNNVQIKDDNKKLLALIYKMYKNKYGEVDHDFVSILFDTRAVRYYFNSNFINEENSYYTEPKKLDEPIDLKTAYDLGILQCFYSKRISAEEYNNLSESEKEKFTITPIYNLNNNEEYNNVQIDNDMVTIYYKNGNTITMSLEGALKSNLIEITGYDIQSKITYEESLNLEIKKDCIYCLRNGILSGDKAYNCYYYEKHYVEPIDKKFPKEEQTIKF